ncbi:MAG: sulfatase [Planctomycetes bacterium]|nr:sulfatase [Planctomycetota bacterium]
MPPPPNIVFILIDDMGWTDGGCLGSPLFETPNLDRLARDGMRFTNGYAACPVCSPTRASIMTGKYPARLRLTNFLVGKRWPADSPIEPVEWQTHLPPAEVTIAEALRAAGYATGHVGKWHLGGEKAYWPESQGFDVNVGGCGSGMPRSYFYPRWKGNPPIEGKPGEYLTDRLTDAAVAFIEANRGRPFFLYFAHYAVHIPLEAKEEMIRKYRSKVKPGATHTNPIYAAMIESVDESVGRVCAALDRCGIAGRTAVFFTSDNGGLSVKEGANTPATSNAPLRAGKGYLYEGGIREPWIIKWPGAVRPGSVCDVPVTTVDVFPTVLEMAGVERDPALVLDGESIVPLLRERGGLRREAVYWHYPHYSNQGGMPGGAVRKGDWKLIEFYEDGALELYDLSKDIGEAANLAASKPEKVAELRGDLDAWRVRVGAQMPARRAPASVTPGTSGSPRTRPAPRGAAGRAARVRT